MRISDWSSDVCSSELGNARRILESTRINLGRRIGQPVVGPLDLAWLDTLSGSYGPQLVPSAEGALALAAADADLAVADAGVRLARSQRIPDVTVGPGVRRFSESNDTAVLFSIRSEEHTSELQPLMRITYAV